MTAVLQGGYWTGALTGLVLQAEWGDTHLLDNGGHGVDMGVDWPRHRGGVWMLTAGAHQCHHKTTAQRTRERATCANALSVRPIPDLSCQSESVSLPTLCSCPMPTLSLSLTVTHLRAEAIDRGVTTIV
jgi:hypothetical protein